jgi:hypothetical protein
MAAKHHIVRTIGFVVLLMSLLLITCPRMAAQVV